MDAFTVHVPGPRRVRIAYAVRGGMDLRNRYVTIRQEISDTDADLRRKASDAYTTKYPESRIISIDINCPQR